MNPHKHTNALINSKSPYLLQHAHNPVNWLPWSEEAVEKAKREDKLILVSVGYSACHWCHVMEHESFEDEEVAAIMNEHFVCIKVDREERPDIDHIYMNAVQLMSGHGGWPLNCFTLPDGRPVYGGTYFPKSQWINLLQNLSRLFSREREKTLQYATELTRGLTQMETFVTREVSSFSMDILDSGIKKWKENFDKTKGGNRRAPKFPMPNNWLYLLRYAHFTGNKEVLKQVHLTLKWMAYGGIYDHVGGGFARYSTDIDWKVPHFEKMLYDNAQLISLYAEAFTESRNPLYKTVVEETIQFCEREMLSPDGGFYSALDADSEGVEGKFYVWEEFELQELIPNKDWDLFKEIYSVNEAGYWEDDNYILLISEAPSAVALRYKLSEEEVFQKMNEWKSILLQARSKRVRPGLDDKILTSWNAMMLSAYCNAFKAFGIEKLKAKALQLGAFIQAKLTSSDGRLFHAYKDGVAYITGFLDDYVFVTEAHLNLFFISGDHKWREEAIRLTEVAQEKFYDEKSGMYYFTPSDGEKLVVRNAETQDNVIPASNSQMARNLYQLSRIEGKVDYSEAAKRMLGNVSEELKQYPTGYSNWGLLQLEIVQPPHEVVIVGNNVDEMLKAFREYYLPNAIFAFSRAASEHSLFRERYKEGETLVYVCRDKTCGLPVKTATEALRQLN